MKRDQSSQCGGKHPHPSWSSAEKEARRVGRKDRFGHLNIYACTWCGGFHVGHGVPRRRQAVRA